MRFLGRLALSAGLVSVLLPVTPAQAQPDARFPFVPLPASVECTTGEHRDVGLSVDASRVVVTVTDRVSGPRGPRELRARALGRSLLTPAPRELPVGHVVDAAGNRYAAATTRRGAAIFRLHGPRVYVLQVTSGRDDATGEAVWLPILDVDLKYLDRAAIASNATFWPSTADLVVYEETLFVALPAEHRVVAMSLDGGADRWGRDRAEVWNHVEAGENAPWAFAPPTSENSFTFPTELSVDGEGRLFIAEHVGGDAGLKSRGDDIWVAMPSTEADAPAPDVARLASLLQCDAQVTGLDVTPGGPLYIRIARSRFYFGLVLKN